MSIKLVPLKPHLLLLCFTCITFSFSADSNAAVILQYHHVDTNTPRETSVRPEELSQHLDWLEDNQFNVIPLSKLITLHAEKAIHQDARHAVISFDDANISVCKTAWPILKARKIPFVVFISTEILEAPSSSQCSWRDLKTMYESGLMEVGNHTHRHLHMINDFHKQPFNEWFQRVINEIRQAETIIYNKLGVRTHFLAYPYGEYNSALQKVVKELGYIGFGQQSGAVGNSTDLSSIPRFPLSGTYANLANIKDKMMALAFPVTATDVSNNPIIVDSSNNPPTLTITLEPSFTGIVRCFTGSGETIDVSLKNNTLIVKAPNPLPVGRNRYNCTSKHPSLNRFYWYSHQWVVID